jgi:hypothetical protein
VSWTGSGPAITLNNHYSGTDFNLLEVKGSGNIDLSHFNVSQWLGTGTEILVDDTGASTSVSIYGSPASDEIIVNGFGDSVRGAGGPDLTWFKAPNAANNSDFQFGDMSSDTAATHGDGGVTLGRDSGLIEGFNNGLTGGVNPVGYTGTLGTISSTAVDLYGYLDVQGFAGLSSTVYTTAPVSGSAHLGSLSSFGVIEDSDLMSVAFTNGLTGLNEKVSTTGISNAVSHIEAMFANGGQEFLFVMYDNHGGGASDDAAVFFVHAHTAGTNNPILAADIQILGVIDHAVAPGMLLPSHFFHIHA